MLRRGFRDLCESHGLEVAGEGASAHDALKLIPEVRPGVAVIEDILQDGTGIEVSRGVRESVPSTRCLLLTGWEEGRAERATVLARAAGFLYKQAGDAAGLVDALRAVASGRTLLTPDARSRASAGLALAASAPWLDASSEERQVLALMTQDLTNEQIAQKGRLAVDRVEDVISSLLLRLGMGGGAGRTGAPSAAAR
ncbi:response regulator [Paenarthrobacter sp. S56]|uniref:response regulator n=1 Tax=Paenarthrobacter sp. S56 TaxID=3138179 RepID=UPI00321AE98B